MAKFCCVSGCDQKHYAHSFCKRHYAINRRYGDPTAYVRRRGPLEQRFWEKVDKRGPEECWNWTAGKTKQGYGNIGTGGRGTPKTMAHRLSYEIAFGPIPDGKYILHSCDNPSCVNPAHLRAGTPKENVHDAMERGRLKNPPLLFGSKNFKAALTDEQVKLIKMCGKEIKTSQLAKLFGVAHSTVARIRNGTIRTN